MKRREMLFLVVEAGENTGSVVVFPEKNFYLCSLKMGNPMVP